MKKTVLHNLFVLVLYISSGFLGLLLSVPPGYATAIWAPSGIALGATLVWGLPSLPGIFLASFLLNFYVTLSYQGDLFSSLNVVIGLIIGMGAVLQALLGWWLVKRFIRLNDFLHLPKDILYFALLTGPISCVVAATIGNLTLTFLGLMSFTDFPLSWVTWWIGDSIGVLIITPVFLILFAKPRKLWQSRLLPVLVPLCLTFIIIIVAHIFYSQSELKRVQSKFTELTQHKLNLLTNELKFVNEAAHAISLFLSATPTVNQKLFQSPANSLLQKNSIIQALYWAPKITNRNDFEEKFKHKIVDKNLDANSKSVYYPILFSVSKGNMIFPNGYDLSSNPFFADALKTTDKPFLHVNHKTKLDNLFITSPAYRFNQIAGYIVIQINFGQLVRQIFDNFLYYSNLSVKTDLSVKPIVLYNKNYSGKTSLYQYSYPIQLNHSRWEILATVSPYFINHEYSWGVWSALTATLFFCVLMNIILFILYGQRYLIQFLMEAKTIQLNTEKAKNLLLLNAATEGIFWIDPHYKITFINPAAEKLLGFSCDELINESFNRVLSEKSLEASIHQAIQNKTIIKIQEAVFIKKDQGKLWVEYTCIPILTDRQVKGAAVIFSDIRKRVEKEKKLKKLALYDPLTELPNRLSFFDSLKHSLARAFRNGTQLGVCFMDIDNFKSINDQFGHVYGDKLLMRLPNMIKPHLREMDYLARIGGDEFGLIFEKIQGPQDIINIFERILLSFQNPIEVEGEQIKMSISIGIAIYPKDGLDMPTLFKKADLAMYQVKSKGKFTFAFYEDKTH